MITEWQIIVFGAGIGGILWALHSINSKLAAILFVLRHQAKLDRDLDG